MQCAKVNIKKKRTGLHEAETGLFLKAKSNLSCWMIRN